MSEQNAAVATGDVAEQVNAEVQTNAEPKVAGGEKPTGDANSGEHEQEQPKRKGGFQRKIERLEQENEYWRTQALRTQSQPEAPKQEASDPEPDAEQYEKDGKSAREYMRDLAKWEARQAIKAEREREAEERKQEAAKSAEQKRAEEFGKKIESARDKFDDYDDVVFNKAVPITKPMSEALMESDLGAEIAYELAKDDGKEAQRISQLSPFKQAVEIGKIEARLAHEQPSPATEEEKPEPVVSKAPPPPTPVRRPAAANVPDIHDPKLPYKQFVKLRDEQVAKKGK